jgi:hypothetical protein
MSYYSNAEKETLFAMHTVFQISDMKQIELRLTSNHDHQLAQLMKYM